MTILHSYISNLTTPVFQTYLFFSDLNTIWKEATIQRLLRLVELPYLEDIIECTEDFVHDQTPDISSRNNIYMSVAKRRSPRLAKPEWYVELLFRLNL